MKESTRIFKSLALRDPKKACKSVQKACKKRAKRLLVSWLLASSLGSLASWLSLAQSSWRLWIIHYKKYIFIKKKHRDFLPYTRNFTGIHPELYRRAPGVHPAFTRRSSGVHPAFTRAFTRRSPGVHPGVHPTGWIISVRSSEIYRSLQEFSQLSTLLQ